MADNPQDNPWSSPPPPQGPGPYQPPPAYPPGSYQPPGYPPPGGGYPPQYGGPGYVSQFAGWWQRVGATLIDGLLVGIPLAIVLSLAKTPTILVDVIIYVVNVTYQIILIGQTGRTVGNRAASSSVVDANTGARPDYGKVAVRAVVQLVLGITVIGGILDWLWPLWDDRNQTLHDKAAGTLVYRTA